MSFIISIRLGISERYASLYQLVLKLRYWQFTFSAGSVLLTLALLLVLAAIGVVLDIKYNESGFLQWVRSTQEGSEVLTVESGSTTIRNIGLAIAAAVALIVAIWRGQVAEVQNEVSRQDLMNERYQKGAEMLGHEVLAVRLAGISALQRLAEQDRQQYHVQVARSLCAFVRYPTSDDDIRTGVYYDDEGGRHYHPARDDVQTILYFLGDRDRQLVEFEGDNDFSIDLRRADLIGADMLELNLSGVDLASAELHGSDLRGANLSGAHLGSAVLCDAKIQGARLYRTDFFNANLTSTIFVGRSHGRRRARIEARGLTQDDLLLAFHEPGEPPNFSGMQDPSSGLNLRVRELPFDPDAEW